MAVVSGAQAQDAPAITSIHFNTLYTPASDDTFEVGETIRVNVVYRPQVEVSGTPRVPLVIGGTERAAAFVPEASWLSEIGGLSLLCFDYTVAAEDYDGDGISVAADGLELNGGSITAASGGGAASLSHSAIATDGSRKVGEPPPLVAEAGADQAVDSRASVTLSGSAAGGGIGAKSYAWAQTGGAPSVTLGNADQASASFTAPSVTVATELEFTLTVTVGSQTATDTVQVTVAAEPPRVTGLSLVSRPRSGDTYKGGETIRAQVWLTGLAVVSGSPRLALGVGGEERTMSYVGLERTRVLEFEYAVQGTDADADGVSIGSTALSLPSGTTLAGEAGGTVGVSLSGHAIDDAPGHKVDGSQSAASPLPDLNACPEEPEE